jgi:hypothetical protein
VGWDTGAVLIDIYRSFRGTCYLRVHGTSVRWLGKDRQGWRTAIDDGNILICLYLKKTVAKMGDITQAHFET